MNFKVSKCPKCKAPIYKSEGCNHMTCYRCNAEWCWICHMVTEDYDSHFSPGSIFGCSGMMEVPQSIILWLFVLTIQLFMIPFIVVGNLSYKVGECFDGLEEPFLYVAAVLFAIFGLPFILVATAILAPFVFIYRAYVLIMIILRNFLFCCCC